MSPPGLDYVTASRHCCTSIRTRSSVRAEPVEESTERAQLAFGEPRAELPIEHHHSAEEAPEQRVAIRRDGDDLRTPVAGDAVASDETVGLHAVQVVGERGPFDTDRGREVALHCMVSTLECGEDQPLGERASSLGEGFVELEAEKTAGASDVEPDRLRLRLHVPTVALSH